jgi:predicted transposase/invertase (TIGR01784 family)
MDGMTENKANREYKNSVFVALCEDKKRLIEIYNAVSNKNYPPDAALKIVTLENVLFLGRRNDVAFLLEDRLIVLLEHQSTVCENMPLRLLIYIAIFYEKWLNANEKNRQAVYGTKLLKIPRPEFYVLYNGKAEFPERKNLRLSDAFQNFPESESRNGLEELCGLLELIVPIININRGFNEEILKKSETLFAYAFFVDLARQYIDTGCKLEEAVQRAVEDCIEKGILEDFLRSYASEVVNMLTAEFKLEDAQQVWKEEGREEGRKEGRKDGLIEGKFEIARRMLARRISVSEIVDITGLNERDILSM